MAFTSRSERICRLCGDVISRSPPLSPNTCIGCYARERKKSGQRKTERAALPAYQLTRLPDYRLPEPAMPIAKQEHHRSPELRRSARGERCVADDCHDTETTVWAHANELAAGKGKSIKAHDLVGAYLCARHHAWLDTSKATRAEKHAAFIEWHYRSSIRIAELIAAGKLKL